MPRNDFYTKLMDGQIRGLTEAGASGNERAAYEYVARFHREAEGQQAVFWAYAGYAAECIGMRADVFSRSLRSLCSKCFYIGTRAVPVLTHLSNGHNGRAASYNDNLYQAVCIDHTYPQSSKAGLPTYTDAVARQDCLPTKDE